MKILHITDLHYSSKVPQYDANQIVQAIIQDCKHDNIECILFTGDLVFSGQNPQDFIDARDLLIGKLADELDISRDRIFICPGNHDVYRNQELSDTTEAIKKIFDSKSLESFITKQSGKSLDESLKNLSHYHAFEANYYNEYCSNPSIASSPFYTVHKFQHDQHEGQRVGIMAINTAWRAIDSETDRGNLLFPMSHFKQGVTEVNKDTDFRILVHHHPVSDFQDWNASEMEDVISSNFHVSFSGHLHKRKLSTQITVDGGIFSCSSAATLALDGTINGFTVLEIDLMTFEGTVDFRSFSRADASVMVQKEQKKIVIPTGTVKAEAIELAKTIRKRLNEESDRADELFVSYHDNSQEGAFLRLYTKPILKEKSSTELAKSRVNVPNVELETLFPSTDNLIIYGKDKSGKTCILYRLLLTYLSEFSSFRILPVLLNCSDFKGGTKIIDLVKILSKYYEVSYNKAIELINRYEVVVLVDNYEPTIEQVKKALIDFKAKYPAIKIVALAEERLAITFQKSDLGDVDYKTLYIHDVSRSEVRSLAKKWPNLSEEHRNAIQEKIFTIFSQLNMPVNYWTVSMFIWIFEKNGDANFHNNVELIQLYIDNLLDRKRLALDKSLKINFDEFKSYLGELAYFLLVDRAGVGYTASYREIVDFTDAYRKRNKRFVIEVSDIISLVIEKGIVRKTSTDSYTFRLNGVFEYFLALHMTQNPTFRNQVIIDDHFYLSFRNELELYAGFVKTDEDFLKEIFKKTKRIFQEIDSTYSGLNVDSQLVNKLSTPNTLTGSLKTLVASTQKSLSFDQQDMILSEIEPSQIANSAVRTKLYYESIESTSDNLERAIYILARVYRNSKIRNEELNNNVLDYILDRMCYLGFKLVDDAKNEPESILNTDSDEDRAKTLLKVLTSFMPLLVQTFMLDAIAQNDLERIFREKIDQLKSNAKNNQFKLFVLYLTLIDSDFNDRYQLLEEMESVIALTALRHSLLFKLYYYLLFKCHDNHQQSSLIEKLIRKLSKELNDKLDLGQVHKSVEKTKNIGRFTAKR